jgi:cell division protease FtsH
VLLSVFHSFGDRSSSAQTLIYSDFLTQVKQGQVREVTIEGQNITGKMISGTPFSTYSPETSNSALIGDLERADVAVLGKPPEPPSLLGHMFISWFPFIVLIGLWIFFMRQMQGGGSGRGAMSFGKSKARLLGEDQININFNDVAGVDEAKEEVAELVEFLRDPSKFQKLGGKIPRGVLMVGSPGTGKTLLAKAIAGEAKVPFFTISGSDFVEMFVGVDHLHRRNRCRRASSRRRPRRRSR